jgi:hypothetical protein
LGARLSERALERQFDVVDDRHVLAEEEGGRSPSSSPGDLPCVDLPHPDDAPSRAHAAHGTAFGSFCMNTSSVRRHPSASSGASPRIEDNYDAAFVLGHRLFCVWRRAHIRGAPIRTISSAGLAV